MNFTCLAHSLRWILSLTTAGALIPLPIYISSLAWTHTTQHGPLFTSSGAGMQRKHLLFSVWMNTWACAIWTQMKCIRSKKLRLPDVLLIINHFWSCEYFLKIFISGRNESGGFGGGAAVGLTEQMKLLMWHIKKKIYPLKQNSHMLLLWFWMVQSFWGRKQVSVNSVNTKRWKAFLPQTNLPDNLQQESDKHEHL